MNQWRHVETHAEPNLRSSSDRDHSITHNSVTVHPVRPYISYEQIHNISSAQSRKMDTWATKGEVHHKKAQMYRP
eukprot:1158689-Pelagomonas_calceolata.AAC.9